MGTEVGWFVGRSVGTLKGCSDGKLVGFEKG